MSSLSMILLLIVLVLGWLDEANKTEWFLYICKGWGGLVRDLLAVDWLLALSAHSSFQAAVSSTHSWLPYTAPPPHHHLLHLSACPRVTFMLTSMYIWRKSWVSFSCKILCDVYEGSLEYHFARSMGVFAKRHLFMGKCHAKKVSLWHSHYIILCTMQRLWTNFYIFKICFRFNFLQPGSWIYKKTR